MCIIIINQKSKTIDDKTLKRCARINPHNLGIVWLDTFDVEYTKSSNWKKLKTDRPYIAHFRYATKGAINKDNTHPFICGSNKDELLMMNGTIAKYGNSQQCDSKVLADHLGNNVKRIHWKKELAQYDCRFVTINTKFKTFQIYNRQDWIFKDGVWYSKPNVLTHTVAVYGTLKKDYSNYYHYLNGKGTTYIGRGQTQDKYPLIIDSLPYLVDQKGTGHNVEVDVFEVSGEVLENLDLLEGHPQWYRRKQITIKLKKSNILAWIYFNPKQIHSDTQLHKKYTQDYGIYYPYKYKPKTYKDVESYTPAWRKATTNIGDVITNTQSVINFDEHNLTLDDYIYEGEPKHRCINCASEVEYDNYSSYRCSGCGNWFTEDELDFNTF